MAPRKRHRPARPAILASLACSLLVSAAAGCDRGEPSAKPAPPREPSAEAPSATRPPKPGERIRQRELDAYCSDSERPLAFYYHGGRPVDRLARRDGCYPLFLADCTGQDPEHCSAPSDQEPGMWCCDDPSASQQASRSPHLGTPEPR